MKRLFLVLLFGGTALSAQEIKPRFAIMDDYVRQILIADWDLHAKDTVLLERGYCLQYQLDFWASEVAYRVTQITRPDTVTEVGSSYIAFSCPKGAGRAELHIHPPNSCLGPEGPCFPGGGLRISVPGVRRGHTLAQSQRRAVWNDPMFTRSSYRVLAYAQSGG